MKRKNGSASGKMASPQKRCEQACEKIQQSIKELEAELPNPDAASCLASIVSEVTDRLCHYLRTSQDSPVRHPIKPQWHPTIALKLAEAAIKIADATLTYARHQPEHLTGILSETSEWPAIVSLGNR